MTCDMDSPFNLYGVLDKVGVDTTSINMHLSGLRERYFTREPFSSGDIPGVVWAAFAFGVGLGGGQALFSRKKFNVQKKSKANKTVDSSVNVAVAISLPVRPQSSQ